MKKLYIQPEIIVLGYEAQSFCGLSIRTPNGNRHSTGGQVDDDEDENAIIDDARLKHCAKVSCRH